MKWTIVVKSIRPGWAKSVFGGWGDSVRETRVRIVLGEETCDLESNNPHHPDWASFSKGGRLPYAPGVYEKALPFSTDERDIIRYKDAIKG